MSFADDVGADHVGEDLPGRDHAEELPLVLLARQDELRGDDPVLDALLVLVDVGEEEVQRGDALDEAVLEALPLRGGDDAGDEVEREDPLEPVLLPVDREGDALAAQGELLQPLAALHVLLGEGLEDGDEGLVVGAGMAAVVEDLVEAVPGRDPLHGRVASSVPRASPARPPGVKAPRARVVDWRSSCRPTRPIRPTPTSRRTRSASAPSAARASSGSRSGPRSARRWCAPAAGSSTT